MSTQGRLLPLALVLALAPLAAAAPANGRPGTPRPAAAAAAAPLIVVQQPTVVAFFPLNSEERKQVLGNEPLEDFRYYLQEDGKHLRRAGIRVEASYAEAFRVRVGGTVRTIRPENRQSGFYFIAPGREPRIVYGVTTDDELLQLAQDYFRKPVI